jgi:hypothetical protein
MQFIDDAGSIFAQKFTLMCPKLDDRNVFSYLWAKWNGSHLPKMYSRLTAADSAGEIVSPAVTKSSSLSPLASFPLWWQIRTIFTSPALIVVGYYENFLTVYYPILPTHIRLHLHCRGEGKTQIHGATCPVVPASPESNWSISLLPEHPMGGRNILVREWDSMRAERKHLLSFLGKEIQVHSSIWVDENLAVRQAPGHFQRLFRSISWIREKNVGGSNDVILGYILIPPDWDSKACYCSVSGSGWLAGIEHTTNKIRVVL